MDPVESFARILRKDPFGALSILPPSCEIAPVGRVRDLCYCRPPDLRPHDYKLSTPIPMLTNSRYREPSDSNMVRRPSRLRRALWQVPHKIPGVQPGRP